MGWFWADAQPPQPSRPAAPHPMPTGDKTPPPGCPMHTAPGTSALPQSAPPPPSCPVKTIPPPSSSSTPSSNTAAPAQHPASAASTLSKLNPLNLMPAFISNTRESPTQNIELELDREASTIPRGDGAEGNWEYPSPQQMYNAMLRKGYTDTDASAVPAMVAVHNFLNEGAWAEILGWEARFSRGLQRGWEVCRYGEENAEHVLDTMERRERMASGSTAGRLGLAGAVERGAQPSLVRFMGRPDEPTPKARFMQFLGWAWPTRYASDPPFDRHDWFVRRTGPDGSAAEVRYVIDYYSGPPEPTGEPVFFLDVRPAVDGPTAACERLLRWGGDVWWRASGGSVRAELDKLNANK